jgi:hypothetical protein
MCDTKGLGSDCGATENLLESTAKGRKAMQIENLHDMRVRYTSDTILTHNGRMQSYSGFTRWKLHCERKVTLLIVAKIPAAGGQSSFASPAVS